MRRIYLDFNASTPVDPQVLKILVQEVEEEQGNPSSTHFHGQHCRQKLDHSRKIIARFLNVKAHDLFFTSGGTEGAALLLQGFLNKNSPCHVISSGVEHACIYQTLKEYQKRGYDISFLSTGPWGAVLPEDVEKAIRPNTRLITLMAVNNETGVKTDIEAIALIAQRANIPFFVDGVAWLGKEKINIPDGVSALFFSGHKIHAPKGIGFGICRAHVKLSPLFFGGTQEFNRRAGTENLPGIVALAEAIRLLEQNQEKWISHMSRLRDLFESELSHRLPNVMVNGLGPRVCNVSNLAFLGMDGESMLIHLDMLGISVSHGSACASGALEPSRVLSEMGLPLSQVKASLRFSFGRTTTEAEIHEAVGIIVGLVKQLNKNQDK